MWSKLDFPFDRRVIRIMVMGVILFLALSFQWFGKARQLIQPVEHVVTDLARQFLASDQPETRILVVDIDESSLGTMGPWPWPRHRVAELVEILIDTYKAKAVGLDIVFPSASPDLQKGDDRLAVLGEYGPVVFAQAFDFFQRQQPLQVGSPVFTSRKGALAFSGDPRPATGFVANHVGLARARCVGNIGIEVDLDGRVRRVPLWVEWRGKTSPLMPLAMLGCAQVAPPVSDSETAGELKPGLPASSWEVPFARRQEAYTVVSASDIFSERAPVHELGGRWVLVGSSALGLNDRAATPLSSSTAGVMVHAAVLTSLLDWQDGSLHTSNGSGPWLVTGWTVLTLALVAWSMNRHRAWVILPLIFTLGILWLMVALWAMRQNQQFIILSPLVAYALVILVIPLEWWVLQREQGRILRSFASYVAPTVLKQMMDEGIQQPLVPKFAEITVLSADMQNYTGLTGHGSLQDAATLTREFLQCLTDPILEHGGTLDKYTGDGLVAFWGAPVPIADHAAGAIEAGIMMIHRVRAWNELRLGNGKPCARVRIGVETGPALVGDLGTQFRSTYTAVGDCINLASKLQSAARNMPTDLVIGPLAAQTCIVKFDLIPVGNEILPGKNEPTVLWTPKELPSSLPLPALDR